MSENSTPAVPAARCIYTGSILIAGDDKLKPSHEHIVPLALGGSNQFTTDDVSAAANSRTGNEIDDEAASLLPFLALRHKNGLKGNRRTIPNVALKGEFLEIPGAPVTLEIDPDANISVLFHNEQQTKGQVVSLETTENRIRFLLKARLEQARKRKLNIFTPFGQIRDEEDIEIALLLAQRTQAEQFKASLPFDLVAYHFAVVRLMIKIALGLAHRVLGPLWTFGPGGDRLRQGLWAVPGSKPPRIKGSLSDQVDSVLGPILGIAPDKHVMAILPCGHKTAAIIALFGGAPGIATIDLEFDSQSFFENLEDEKRGGCVLAVPLASEVSRRPLVSRTFRQIAQEAERAGLFKAL